MDTLIIIIIAFFVAILFSLLGLGGGIIYTPLFYLTGLPLLTAIPMALLLNMISTASASFTYLKQRLVDKRVAYQIILTSILGAFAGSYIAQLVDTEVLVLLLSAVVFVASMRLLIFNNNRFSISVSNTEKAFICAASGLLIGAVSSLVGIGGGTFIVPLLMVLGYETRNATATSTFIIIFISLAGFLGHLSQGVEQLDTGLLLYAGAATFIGAQAGSRLIFMRTSSRTIELLFAGILLLVVGKLLYGLV